MSAQPVGHLRLVRTDDDGEIIGLVDSDALTTLEAELEKAKLDLKMAQRDVKAKNRRIAELERHKARERLEHPRYSDAVRVAKYWWRKCRAGNARINYKSPDRLDAVLALMEIEEIIVDADTKKRRREPHYAMVDFKAAIDGAAFDHFCKARKNGSEQHYDDLELICRTAAKFDEFVARAPYDVALARTREEAHTPVQGSKHEAFPASTSSEVRHAHGVVGVRGGRHAEAGAAGWLRLRVRVDPGFEAPSA